MKYIALILLVPSLLLAEEPKQKTLQEASDVEIKLELCSMQLQACQMGGKAEALASELQKREGKKDKKSDRKKDE